jgi:hypothetical protein
VTVTQPDLFAPVRRDPRRRLLSWLLRHANAHPPATRSKEFYALKDRLLRRYAAHVGSDVQRIAAPCWGRYPGPCEGDRCPRCGGTGVYAERFIALERWNFAGRIFHRPVGPARSREVTIEGRIEHRGVAYRTAQEAALWLALLCDRRLFWGLLSREGRPCGWQWRPMLALRVVVFEARFFGRRVVGAVRGCVRRLRARPIDDDLLF